MEREQTNRAKGSRVIQQKSGTKGQVNIVDNRANPFRSLMMGGKVSQRVIQREGEANGNFIYVPRIRDLMGQEKDRVPYTGGKIKFTKYQDTRLLSAGFHGCYMMAFHFTENEENAEEITKLFQGTAIPDSFDDETFYVAHVASNARNALYDAEERKLIVIDAIFRPYNNATQGFVVGGTTKEDKNMGKMDLSAGMEKRAPNTWIGSIYDQEKNPDKTGWIINERATIDGSQMNTQTQATKAYIYARVCLDAIHAKKYDRMVVALRKLCEIKKTLPSAIYIARDQILFSTDITEPYMKDYVYGNEGIVEFLNAIICGLEQDYILYLVKRIRDRSVQNSLAIQPAPPTDIPSIMTRL